MKKYIVTLAAMALAIGGAINLSGCGGGSEDDPNAVGEGGGETKGTDEPTQAELDELAKEKGFTNAPPTTK